MNQKQKMTAVLTAAAVCGVCLTGCGSAHKTAEHAAERQGTTVTDTTRRTAQTTPVRDDDDDPFDYDEQPHATSGPDIADRAESALDRAEDAVTGLLTDAAEETHTHR